MVSCSLTEDFGGDVKKESLSVSAEEGLFLVAKTVPITPPNIPPTTVPSKKPLAKLSFSLIIVFLFDNFRD
jgi:hypothetical protein